VTSVLLADDQELVRTGFRMILEAEPDMRIVGEARDGREAVEQARRTRPDVVLMDVRMPGMDGIEATGVLRDGADAERGPHVLVLTTFDLDEHVYDALRAGAAGFLLKDVRAAQLVDAVRVVAAGEAMIAPAVTRRLIAEFARRAPRAEPPAGLDELTPRELEVLRLLARGLSNAEIARELWLGEATVKTHLSRVLAKLRLRDRVQAVVLAYECGLVKAGERET
jgi:DNA-binding NarL/FixJ family response regulator